MHQTVKFGSTEVSSIGYGCMVSSSPPSPFKMPKKLRSSNIIEPEQVAISARLKESTQTGAQNKPHATSG